MYLICTVGCINAGVSRASDSVKLWRFRRVIIALVWLIGREKVGKSMPDVSQNQQCTFIVS